MEFPVIQPNVLEPIWIIRILKCLIGLETVPFIKLQLVCNADGLITSYNTKYLGSTRDAFIWSNCTLRTRFENRSHSRTHVIIEQTFSILKSRFMCLHLGNSSI
ncbi:uncharacterized protein LOC119575968 [Penaeus monodon]|uniref:uncharacterized protein LOC119575968 n=1 Tax=Penaeus monodon TaxID=6687 RepID=UPI0018A6EFD9|nr:uncharacterized protein LOC119575968 [Penaeus monodon]